jgi:hypothetical protein
MRRAPLWLGTVAVVAGLATAGFFVAGLPGLDTAPGWFYRAAPHGSLGVAFALLVAALAPFAVMRALRAADAGRHTRAIAALVLVGTLAQIGLVFLAPGGLSSAWRRLSEGHGEYLRIAHAREGKVLETLRDYEALAESGTLGGFARSKPPGTLAAYLALDALAETRPVAFVLAPLVDEARHSPLAAVAPAGALAFLLFPLLTYLTILPLILLGRALLHDARTGYDAALLWLSAPAVLLIDLHLDGALFPLLGTTAVALAAIGARSRRPFASLAGGCVAAVGTFCTFGLAPVVGLGVGCSLVLAGERAAHGLPLRTSARSLAHALLFLAGFAVVTAAFVLLLHYDPLVRYEHALALHAEWKAFVPTRLWRALSLVEFFLYAGVPLALAFAAELAMAGRSVLRRELAAPSYWTLGVGATLGVLAAFQGTNEVARLWIFMIPFLALSVAGGLRGRFAADPRRGALLALAATQAALAVVMKVTQPW